MYEVIDHNRMNSGALEANLKLEHLTSKDRPKADPVATIPIAIGRCF